VRHKPHTFCSPARGAAGGKRDFGIKKETAQRFLSPVMSGLVACMLVDEGLMVEV
jgi:hypothetical protein